MFTKFKNKMYPSNKKRFIATAVVAPIIGSVIGGAAFFSVFLVVGLAVTSIMPVSPAETDESSAGRFSQLTSPGVQTSGDGFGASPLQLVTTSSGDTTTYGMTVSGGFSEVSPSPDPVAAWLFGSALLGISIATRKKSVAIT